MIYQHENYGNVREEIKPLIIKHWEEIALNQDIIELNPDWDAYGELDRSGLLRVFTVRNKEESLVGYFVVIVSRSLHYKDHVFANNDIIFVLPEYRKGTTGIKLIDFAERELEAEGIRALNINTKDHQSFDAILQRRGYQMIERVYSKVWR
jgi:GNAT superfamily N-acetyltransferase